MINYNNGRYIYSGKYTYIYFMNVTYTYCELLLKLVLLKVASRSLVSIGLRMIAAPADSIFDSTAKRLFRRLEPKNEEQRWLVRIAEGNHVEWDFQATDVDIQLLVVRGTM